MGVGRGYCKEKDNSVEERESGKRMGGKGKKVEEREGWEEEVKK